MKMEMKMGKDMQYKKVQGNMRESNFIPCLIRLHNIAWLKIWYFYNENDFQRS